ncbi:MAG TPA: hypothetical protein VHU84_08425 [Lacipirellulaceae bacterium]|jgi:hypothetical protein|nr:hypothetical protein [Lacipirellulaceae bacterium]
MDFRFTTKGLMIATTLIAVGFSGFLYPNSLLSAGIYTAAVLIIICGMAAALLGQGAGRAYWVGFTICGAGFLYMATMDEDNDSQPVRHVPREPTLLTTQLLWRANGLAPSWRPHTYWTTASAEGVMRIGNRLFSVRDEGENFVRIGNSLFALVFAFLGGAAGRRSYVASRHHTTSES